MINTSPHISSEIENAFSDINQDLLTLASRSRNAFTEAAKGFLQRDDDICNRVVAHDDEIDDLDDSINHKAMEVLLRFRPVAVDMRTTLASLRLSNAFERVGDESVSISRISMRLNQKPKHSGADSLESVFVKVRRHYEDSLISFTEKDAELATKSITVGASLTEQISDSINKIAERIGETEQASEPQVIIDLAMVMRSLKNIVGYSNDVANEMLYLDQDIETQMGR